MLTRAEDLFWEQVRAGRFHGHKFKRQVPIAPYIVDFLCTSARIIVELDGPPHEDMTQRKHDRARDAFLCDQGFHVLRFTNDELLGNPQLVMDRVLQAIERAQTLPPLRGRVASGASRERGRVSEADLPLSRPSLTRRVPSPAEGGG